MPYQGNTPVESYIATVKDSFNGNGSTTAFTMSKPTQVNDVRVVVENVIQDPSVAYTVSGTTITFTSAPPSGTNNIYVIHLGPAVATAQPPAEIADATTFASNVSVQGSFTSPGIDDNADAVALTIDSSEVVLVGKTSNTFSQQGVALRANNDSQITRDGGNPLSLNRTSSDGDIAKFFKDGTTVGSIGTVGANLHIEGTTSGLSFQGNDVITPVKNSVRTDAVIDLGDGSRRFKDAYLSGGVYLGGTGSANKLDDFETGTWTATLQNAPGGISNAGTATHNKYTKVGNLVTISGYVELNTTSPNSGNAFIVDGLPFAPNVTNAIAGSMICRYGSADVYSPYMGNNQRIEFYKINNSGNWNLMTYANLNGVFSVHFTVSYTA